MAAKMETPSVQHDVCGVNGSPSPQPATPGLRCARRVPPDPSARQADPAPGGQPPVRVADLRAHTADVAEADGDSAMTDARPATRQLRAGDASSELVVLRQPDAAIRAQAGEVKQAPAQAPTARVRRQEPPNPLGAPDLGAVAAVLAQPERIPTLGAEYGRVEPAGQRHQCRRRHQRRPERQPVAPVPDGVEPDLAAVDRQGQCSSHRVWGGRGGRA